MSPRGRVPEASGSDETEFHSERALTTLLVSDLVGSTQLVRRLGDARAAEVFGRHDRMARDLLRADSGLEIDKADGFLMLFERPLDAVLCAALEEAPGEREDIARIADWSFDQASYYVESEYTAGGSLADRAEEQGGLAAAPRELRLELVAPFGTEG